jgi:DNA-binding LacI/PurR family transcriptional regulator
VSASQAGTAVIDPARRSTLHDIAAETGVSLATVSKVINDRPDVSAETRSRVRASIERHGYTRVRREPEPSPLLELVINELESEWAVEIIRGVEQVARENGLAVVVSEMEGHRQPVNGWVSAALARRPVGVVAVLSDLTAAQRDELRSRGIPLVIVDPAGEPLHGIPSVGATNWSGGLAATRHLLSLGHRRIGVISGPSSILCSRARLDGYRAAMDEAGVVVDPELVRTGDFHVSAGIREARSLFALPDPPTAIFAGSDLQALGVYQAAREARLHIPEDISVVGFDDLPVAGWVGPPLTTVRQPLVDMAMAGARLVLSLRSGEELTQTRLELATELVVRESTAPPR